MSCRVGVGRDVDSSKRREMYDAIAGPASRQSYSVLHRVNKFHVVDVRVIIRPIPNHSRAGRPSDSYFAGVMLVSGHGRVESR